MSRVKREFSYDHQMSQLFFLLSMTLFASLLLAILSYREPFRFWHHAFSDLGNVATPGGQPNAMSRLILSAGMLIDGAIMLRLSAICAGREGLRHAAVKQWLARLGAIGFLVALCPNDVDHTIHSIGVGTVIGVVYLFTVLFHLELRPWRDRRLFYGDLLVLHAAVFSYAAAFFANLAVKQTLQKTCVLAVFLSLERIVTAGEQSFHPREVLSYLARWQH